MSKIAAYLSDLNAAGFDPTDILTDPVDTAPYCAD